jgi:hypothetical protein
MHHKHPRHKKYFKKEGYLGRFNLKGQIQNEIGFSYLGHLGISLI